MGAVDMEYRAIIRSRLNIRDEAGARLAGMRLPCHVEQSSCEQCSNELPESHKPRPLNPFRNGL
jgi:hypothetical protein